MATLNISLPEPLKDFVEERANEDGYMSSSEYIRELIRAAMHRLTSGAQLETLLLEGINSGDTVDADSSYWSNKKQKLSEAWTTVE